MSDKENLLEVLNSRTILKQDVYENSKRWFKVLKKEIAACVKELKSGLKDERIRLKFVDKSENEAQLFVGSDILVFYLHSNVFKFSDNDFASKSSYVQNNPDNAYCGIINVYDFLADSYEYARPNDLGYLISRIFINKEDHFVVEGKGQIGFLYRNFMNQVVNKEILHDIILRVSTYAIEFDLLTPPYQNVQQVTVYDLQTLSQNSKLKTGKRLGFQFRSEQSISGEKKL